MKKLYGSICSTCKYVAGCTLTRAKDRVCSCSEYVHRLQQDNGPMFTLTLQSMGEKGFRNLHEELVLN
ncbi:hypothetical protein [Pseudozobellia thermophila]|uniref:Uncharacterized protein n=1 Tax=Pseudozobellia thermophila TaxID=192903 RepID=A0A1M6EGX4_9FLAO|nr:hypothetical protein [Pseudozobellia thermophila]SHI84639.1 hypothetical protein SAMN04488513_10254 [Pseudozobellia thermophila]